MEKVGIVDYFDGTKRKLFFFVENDDLVEEEGFYKVETGSKIFYIFVTNLSEVPLDSEISARIHKNDFLYDVGERFILYAQANVLMEHRIKEKKNIVGYKTIPRHGEPILTLQDADFDILKLPRLDFAHVRSGSKKLETTAGFKKSAYITHWLLSGWTNSGKTNSAKILLGVTVKGDDKGPFAGGVVIDPHGEYYRDLKFMNSKGEVRIIHLTLDPSKEDPNEKMLAMPLGNLRPSDLLEVVDFSQETQVPLMARCKEYFWRNKKNPESEEDADIVKDIDNWVDLIIERGDKVLSRLKDFSGSAGQMVLYAVKRRLQHLIKEDRKVWLAQYEPIVKDIVRDVSRGTWYVIDVSSISNNTTKLITSMINYKLFDYYKETAINNRAEWNKFKPAGMLVEEAHNYLSPEASGRGNIVAKIAKEGRKFKVFTIIVEQDPSGIDERILKQIHNKITLQLIPVDAQALVKTTPYIGELEKKIPYYETGEGVFVSTGSFNFALPVKFPHMDEWVENNSDLCKKCKKNRVLIKGQECTACGKKQLDKDIKQIMK